MAKKINVESSIKKRIVEEREEQTTILSEDEVKKNRYLQLVENLKQASLRELKNAVIISKTIREIKINKLYIYGGYSDFKHFVSDYHIARAQAYKYLHLAGALESGLVEESYVLKHGIERTIRYLKREREGEITKLFNKISFSIEIPEREEDFFLFLKEHKKFLSKKIFELLKREFQNYS